MAVSRPPPVNPAATPSKDGRFFVQPMGSTSHFSPDSEEVKKHRRPAWRTAGRVFSRPIRRDDPNRMHMNHSEALVEVFRKTPPNGGSRRESGRVLECHREHDGHKDVYGRIDPKRPGPTMTTACINPSKGRFVHPTKNHGISVRHAARFQTFPDSFEFDGGLTSSGKQIGNAIPIEHGEHILGILRDAILNSLPEGTIADSMVIDRGTNRPAKSV